MGGSAGEGGDLGGGAGEGGEYGGWRILCYGVGRAREAVSVALMK
jgi:hypothetical protein